MTFRKYDLPRVLKFTDVKFDIRRLRQAVRDLDGEFVNVLESNKGFCSNNHILAKSVYSHFEQVTLTTFNGEQKTPSQQDCEALGSQDEPYVRYKKQMKDRANIPPELNEHNYNFPTELYKKSGLKNEIEGKFASKPIRVRLVKLKREKALPPHIDYDPSYAIRIVVPIFTNDKVINKFWNRGREERYFLPADGSAYLLNVGFKHSVENLGDVDRVTLMFSLEDQRDLHRLGSKALSELRE